MLHLLVSPSLVRKMLKELGLIYLQEAFAFYASGRSAVDIKGTARATVFNGAGNASAGLAITSGQILVNSGTWTLTG